ncbi:hypothetical protein OFN32_25240, partial [Escherichia coli]|nr:hypothetical protein [Escherichia coli]
NEYKAKSKIGDTFNFNTNNYPIVTSKFVSIGRSPLIGVPPSRHRGPPAGLTPASLRLVPHQVLPLKAVVHQR